jgi:hypothetical protein
MTRIIPVQVIIAAVFASVATSFTTTTTHTTSNHCNHKRKSDHDVLAPMNVFITQRQPVFSFTMSTTLLFDGKESRASTESSSILDGVVELGESTTTSSTNEKEETKSSPGFVEQAVAPFFSQGEIDPQTLNPDLSDPKQARVIIYIILSLVPVLFLIPLMIGSRDLIPLDAVSPVQL